MSNHCHDPSKHVEQEDQFPNYTLQTFCPYVEKDGHCEALNTGRYCPYIHGDECDLCQKPVLHPSNQKQREHHRAVRFKKLSYEKSNLNFRNV